MTYSHTQRAPMYLIPFGSALFFLGVALLLPAPLAVRVVVFAGAVLILFLAYCFKTLTVQDEGMYLALRFGPVPVFRKRITYADITEVKRARSKIVDGWGIHHVAGRGWTYNLWGFDCVEIRLGSKTIRIGTDDPDGLVQFLKGEISSRQ